MSGIRSIFTEVEVATNFAYAFSIFIVHLKSAIETRRVYREVVIIGGTGQSTTQPPMIPNWEYSPALSKSRNHR
jgi:hypothetical protein